MSSRRTSASSPRRRAARPRSSSPTRAGRSGRGRRVVATVYWRKFPSTLRLGSRMWTSSSLFGCAAMPVRSGPTLPPSPECVWHLAHCFLKTSLPRDGVAALQDDRRQRLDDLLRGRGRAGRRPWRAAPWPARRSTCPGWAASACVWTSDRSDIGTLPASIAVDQRARPVRLAEQRAGRSPAGPPGSSAPSRRPGPSRPRARRSSPTAAIRPLARSGGVFAVTRAITSRAACGVALAEVDELPGGVDAGGLGASSRRRPSRGGPRRSRRRTRPSPLTPQREAQARASGRASRPRASAGAAAIAFSAASSSVGGLVLRPALGQAGDDRLARPAASAASSGARIAPTASTGPPRA